MQQSGGRSLSRVSAPNLRSDATEIHIVWRDEAAASVQRKGIDDSTRGQSESNAEASATEIGSWRTAKSASMSFVTTSDISHKDISCSVDIVVPPRLKRFSQVGRRMVVEFHQLGELR